MQPKPDPDLLRELAELELAQKHDRLDVCELTPADISAKIAQAEASPLPATMTAEDVLAARRETGGRAQDRIGKGREYLPHENLGAILRRRRQRERLEAKRGTFTCPTCGENEPIAGSLVTDDQQRVCAGCADFMDTGGPHAE